MIYIILLIVIFALFYQSGRISKLESILKSSTQQNFKKPEVNSEINNVEQPHILTQESVPLSPQAKPIETENTISEEETSGRVLGRIGIIAVILGVGFFIKYAFDNNWVGPAGRVMIGIMIGIGIMGLGQFLRRKYLNYSDMLIGGGMVILYISIYSAYNFYHLIDPMMAFMGMIVVTAVGVFLSIINATKTLSSIAFIGGFLAPFIIGPQYIDSWIVFTYITILNFGVLGILLYKKFTNLIVIGLIGTWIYFGWWYGSFYQETMLIPTLIFLLLQYLIFTGSSLIRIIVEKIKATEVDYFVLAGTALSFALICYDMLMPQYKHYVSIGAVMVAVFYMAIAVIAYKSNPEDRTVNIFLPGLGVTFLTVAVPIEFSGPWISAWWFIEALVLYIIASSSSSRGFQVMGVLVYIFGLMDLFYYMATYSRPIGYAIFFNGPFVMMVMAILVAYAIAFTYYRYGSINTEIQNRGIAAFIVIANILTLYAISSQIIIYYDLQQALGNQSSVAISKSRNMSNISVSIFWALYAAILAVAGFAKKYVAIRRMSLALFVITAFKVVIDVWNLGELYRIISFIVFGVIALTVSFIYVKFKDRLNQIV